MTEEKTVCSLPVDLYPVVALNLTLADVFNAMQTCSVVAAGFSSSSVLMFPVACDS